MSAERRNLLITLLIMAVLAGELFFLLGEKEAAALPEEFVIKLPYTAMEPGQEHYISTSFTVPQDAFLTSFHPDIKGNAAVLHHADLFNVSRPDRYCQGAPLYLYPTGSEMNQIETFKGDYGIFVQKGQRLILSLHLANQTGESQEGTYELHMGVKEYAQPIEPVFLSIADYCTKKRSPSDVPTEYSIPPEFSHHEATMQRPFIVPKDGMLVGWGGHLHQYGTSLSILHNGKAISTLTPGKNPRTDVDPESVYLEGAYFADNPIPVKQGEALDLRAAYDKPAGLFYPGAMGIGYVVIVFE